MELDLCVSELFRHGQEWLAFVFFLLDCVFLLLTVFEVSFMSCGIEFLIANPANDLRHHFYAFLLKFAPPDVSLRLKAVLNDALAFGLL